MVEARHQERRIDVGRDDLFRGLIACDFAREETAPGQDGVDRRAIRLVIALDRHPIADGRQVASALRIMPHPSRDIRERLAIFEIDAERRAVRNGHARGHQIAGISLPNASAS